MLHILYKLVAGFIVAWIAEFILQRVDSGKVPSGCIVTSLVGIVGSALGNYGWVYLFKQPEEGIESWIAVIVGTIVVLLVYRLIFGAKR